MKAVLKKYYCSLLYKVVCQVQQKKTQHERFSLMLAVLSDPVELRFVFDLYGLKLESQSNGDQASEPIDIFAEASKAYYSFVLDRAWANDILQTELQFWDLLGLMLEHGHKLKSSFWQANPLQSKNIDSCSKELEMLEQNLRGFTQMLTSEYVNECRARIVNLMQIAMHSAYRQENTSATRYEKVDIIRNQVCFGPHHCQGALVSLRKLHDIAQANALVSHSHSRM